MGKGIILRVLEGTVLSSELSASLSKLLPGYQLEYFKAQPDYVQSINRRIDSLHQAFLFLLKVYPVDPRFTPVNIETIKAHVIACKANLDLKKETFEDLHQQLEKFTHDLVALALTCWSWPKTTFDKEVAEVTAALNEAEQYVLMSQGRSDLATLVPIQLPNRSAYVLQVDETLSPLYKELVDELTAIQHQNYPKTPNWYRKCQDFEQAYFCHLDARMVEPTDIIQDLNRFISFWEGFKRSGIDWAADLAKIQNDDQALPTWFDQLNSPTKAMVRVLANDGETFGAKLYQFKDAIITHRKNKNPEFHSGLHHVAKIPEWYWAMSPRQQDFLKFNLTQANSITEAISFLSSRQRTIPAPANYAVHSLYCLDEQGAISMLGGKRYRSSHVASRDMLKSSKSVQNRHTHANLLKVTESAKPGQPILMQTLISPIPALDYVPSIFTDYLPDLPDLELYNLARIAVKRSRRASDILQSNHPFNFAKLYYYTTRDSLDCSAIVKAVSRYTSTKPGLQELIDDYVNVLNSAPGTATFFDYAGRELFLSSLEQLMIMEIGGFSYGSCVSGKDRKAIELIHTDAMMVFKEMTGTWPKFGDAKEKRDLLVLLITKMYLSAHQKVLADSNAPGSMGIKTPGLYLAKDCAESINKALGNSKALEHDDRLATDNEVKNISKALKDNLRTKMDSLRDELLCKLVAEQLGEKNCTDLYSTLYKLINEKKRFKNVKEERDWKSFVSFFSTTKVSGPTPTGIKMLYDIMDDKSSGKDNVQKLYAMFLIILSRPETDESRTRATNAVYNRIRALLRPLGPELSMQTLVDRALQEWTDLFNESILNNSVMVVK